MLPEWRRFWLAFWLGLLADDLSAFAVVFSFRGATIELEQITTEVDVYYRSMRWNRAAGAWNLELVLSNKSSRVFYGPYVYSAVGLTNTTGLLEPDGWQEAGAYVDLSSVVPDGRLDPNEVSLPYTLALGPGQGVPGINHELYARPPPRGVALAVTRTLDEMGQPLPGVTVTELGPADTNTFTSDPVLGFVTLGQSPGAYAWRFSAPDHLPVWRWHTLGTGAVQRVAPPRLTPRNTNVTLLNPLNGGALISSDGRTQVRFAPGTTLPATTAALTPLHGQALPAPLPPGWSALQAFWLELAPAQQSRAEVSMEVDTVLSPADTVALVRWNEAALQWMVDQVISVSGQAVTASVPAGGAYALVVGDPTPTAPPTPIPHQPLVGVALPPFNPSNVVAKGRVTPHTTAASRVAELVTARAVVNLTNRAGPLPSGVELQADLTETYQLNNGTRRFPPRYEAFLTGYQRPGDADPATVQAAFSLRPLLLFGHEELTEATVRVDLLPPAAFAGVVLTPEGGQLAHQGLRLVAGAGDVLRPRAAQLRRQAPTNFVELVPTNFTVVAAFDLALEPLAPGRRLRLQLTGAPTNALFVLGRVRMDGGLYGVEPRERLASDARGVLDTLEPPDGSRLPGLTGAGQYVLLGVNAPHALIEGVARDGTGQPLANLAVRLPPWLAFSAPNGAYQLLAPIGTVTLTTLDLTSGDTGQTGLVVTNAQTPVTANVGTLAENLRVVSVNPANGATRVLRVTPVVVQFNRPLAPGAALAGAQLLGSNGAPVAATLTVNLARTALTLLPLNPLAPDTLHTVALATNLTDATGRPLTGPALFTFRTEPETLDRTAAQVVSYEPTNGLARMTGSAGIAEPQSPVILVNETRGTTATVLSGVDGSFDNFIAADVDDVLSAQVVNRNGTRTKVPVSRQLFRDGRVGLFQQGGVIEVESPAGPVRVTIEPGAIQEKNVFKVEPLTLAQLGGFIGTNPPVDGTLLTGLRVRVEGQPMPDGAARVNLPFDPTALGLSDPENGAYALAIVRQNDEGGAVYQIVDRLRYAEGRLFSNPLAGFLVFAANVAGPLVADFVLSAMMVGLNGLPLQCKVTGATEVSGTNVVYQPLQGAIVTLHSTSIERVPGRVPTGLAYAMTDANGLATLVGPRNRAFGLYLSASHPRYNDFDTKPVSTFLLLEQAGVQRVEFQLQQPAAPVDPLKLTWSWSPALLPIGGPATFEAVATHGSGAPSLSVAVAEVFSLDAGSNAPLPLAAVVLSNRVETTEAKTRRVRLQVVPPPAVKSLVKLRVQASAGGSTQTNIATLRFDGVPVTIEGPLPLVDVNDSVGPMVVGVFPPAGAVLNPGQRLQVRFNEPVSAAVTNPALGAVAVGGPGAPVVNLTLAPDQQTLEVGVAGALPDRDYQLTLDQSVVDLRGNPLDQDPASPGAQSFTLKFRSAATGVTSLPGLGSGGGVEVFGNAAFALDRTAGNERLVIYDVSDPTTPRRVSEFRLPPFPRDLCLIPRYSFVNVFNQPPLTNRNIIVVVGGEVGFAGNSAEFPTGFVGQWLRAIDVTDPNNPTRLLGAVITRRESVVSKIIWRAPFLVYLERAADLQQVAFVNFQEMVLGFNNPGAHESGLFGLFGRRGEDNDGNGDFVGPDDRLPIPPKNVPEFFGKVAGLTATLERTTQGIQDFDFEAGYLSVVLSAGRRVNANGQQIGDLIPPQYRTLSFAGDPVFEPTGLWPFAPDARPKRLTIVPGVPLPVNNALEFRTLALVSLSPDADGRTKLAVLDITLATAPQLVRLISFPAGANLGLLQSARLRDDGLLQVATTADLILLDPAKLSLRNPPAEGLHPAVVSVLPRAGTSGQTFGGNDAGVTVVALGGRNEVIQSAPRLSFVAFTNAVFDPLQSLPPADQLRRIVAGAQETASLEPALVRKEGTTANDFQPPQPGAHYYVMVRAPGGIGPVLDLGLESLNRSGYPMANRGRGFAPVRAMSDQALGLIQQRARAGCDAPIPVLRARRLSDDWRDPLYNVYLSQPIALVTQKTTPEELAALAQNPVRVILWSGFYLRAFLDPSVSHPAAQPFAAIVDPNRKVVLPRASVVAETLPGGYQMGPNPPPPGGALDVPGTFGTLSAHNGEFRHETVDMALPGRRLPIVFERTVGGQDLHDGPFGRGWDHVFDQQLTWLRPELFSGGRNLPLIVRALVGDNTTARPGDVIFQTGAGRNILFKNKGRQPPPEIANDPLVQELGWISKTDSFFLPDATEKGVFDVLFRFVDGQFARLTPDGMQFWYSSRGRLEKIYHRYPKNFIQLGYNERGDLVRLTDGSIPNEARFLRIGYFRFPSDPDADFAVDRPTTEPFVAGKIARLMDYTGREILYDYTSDGLLERRRGPALAGANGGFSGLPETRYVWSDACSGAVMGVIAGNGSSANGTPLFTASLTTQNPVATGGVGAAGNVGFTPPPANQAGVDNAQSSSTGPDGAQTGFTFDKFGFSKEIRMTGNGAPQANMQTRFNALGLLEEVVYPEGNSVRYTYDTSNVVFRARGNLLKEEHFPGPRGGSPAKLEATFAYDLRYNLPAGAHTDFNGNTLTYGLRGDGRDVTSINHAGAGTQEFDYDDFGQLLRVKTPEGIVTAYSYDAHTGFRRTETRGPAPPITYGYDNSRAGRLGVPTTVSLPRGAPVSAKYDDRLMLTEMTRGAYAEQRAYDENGNQILMRRTLGGGRAYEETRVYNQINFLASISLKNVETGTGTINLITTFVPDAAWRVKEMHLPGGEVRKFNYDHLGHLRRMELGSYFEEYDRDLHGNLRVFKRRGTETQRTEYDGYDRPVRVVSKGDGGDEVTTLTYFGKGERRLLKIEDPRFGTVLEVEHLAVDALGRPTSVIRRGQQTSANIAFAYPAGSSGGSTVQTGPRDTFTTGHDGAGRIIARRHSATDVTLTPDGNGNITSTVSTEGSATFTAEFTYNELDHQTAHSDGVGLRFAYTPRLDGLPTSIRDGLDQETTQTHSVLGELLALNRPSGVQFRHRYDANRQPSYTGDPDAGHALAYADGTLRLTEKRLRNGATLTFANANNPVNLPQNITMPGGSMTMSYDLQERATAQQVNYVGGNYRAAYTLDALGRVRAATYGSAGQHSATYTYDRLGPLTAVTFNEAHGSFTITSQIQSDGTRAAVTYPSGVTLQEQRHPSGRLERITGPGGALCNITSYAGAEIPGQSELGGVIRETVLYDGRKRIVSRRYERIGDGRLLADVRYQYDPADNVRVRQQVHRHGRADLFSYDSGNRLLRAELGARPQIPAAVRTNATGLTGGAGFAPGLFARNYAYDGGGLDLLQTIATANPDGLTLPPFAATLTGHDGFLNAGAVNGFARASDPVGNTTATLLAARPGGSDPVLTPATLTYNGLSHLVRVQFPSTGVQIAYEYQPNGLMHRRTVTQNGTVLSDTALVWDEGRLIEEYERTGGSGAPALRARYYYADDDSPFAGDFFSGGLTNRFYFLRDALSSVVAVADANGEVIERVHYDAWGQPEIQGRDTQPPALAGVFPGGGNSVLVAFTEPVLPPRGAVTPGTNLLATLENFAASRFILTSGGQTVTVASVNLEENLGGLPFGAVVRLNLSGVAPSVLTLRVGGGTVADEWGLTNAEQVVTFTNGVPRSVAALGSTGPPRRARSAVGNPFLFHGAWFDYDAGLAYMRARFYDPFTGHFLQRDPEEYADSVNLYAGFANNPTSDRDPTGRMRLIRWVFSLLTKSPSKRTVEQEVKAVLQGTAAAAQVGKSTIRPAAKVNPLSAVAKTRQGAGSVLRSTADSASPAAPNAHASAKATFDTKRMGSLRTDAEAARTDIPADLLRREIERLELAELSHRELAPALYKRHQQLFKSIRTGNVDDLVKIAQRNNIRINTAEQVAERYGSRLPVRPGDVPGGDIFAENRVARAVEEEGFSLLNEAVVMAARAGDAEALERMREGIIHTLGARFLMEVRGSYEAILPAFRTRDFGRYETHFLDALAKGIPLERLTSHLRP
ncbi:MAG: Ig-like domain-containing protein [Verrucomicrobiota bacterium]|nr:Ig-like domain-containing protein [Verrucomicrobiota bacterium]